MNQPKLQQISRQGAILMAAMGCLMPAKWLVAADVEKELKFKEAYSSPVAQTLNEAGYQSSVQIRESMRGSKASIPNTWKLISAVLKQNGSSYILFFQDDKSNVHTLDIDSNGAITGADAIDIPSHAVR